MAPWVLPLAALMAFSRVFVGVHYPHDVVAGFVLGVVAAPLAAVALAAALRPLVVQVRAVAVGAALLGPPVSAGRPVPVPGPAAGGAAGGPTEGASVTRADEAAVTMPDVMGGVTRRGPLP